MYFANLIPGKTIECISLQQSFRSSTDRIMVSGTIDMSSNLVGSTKSGTMTNFSRLSRFLFLASSIHGRSLPRFRFKYPIESRFGLITDAYCNF